MKSLHTFPFFRRPWAFWIGLVCLVLLLVTTLVLRPDRASQLQEILAPKTLDSIPKNLSGLTWNNETGTLFAVTNDPECAFELTPEGEVLRRIELLGFKDTEGITHLGETLFAIVEERKGVLSIVNLPSDAMHIDHENVMRVDLGKTPSKNKGFESLSFDPATRTIMTMREGRPFIRMDIPLDQNFRPGTIRTTPLPDLRVKDVASIVFDTDGTMWVLSEASASVVQLNPDGRQLRSFALRIDRKKFRPEGITLCPDGRIFIVGEPNILAGYVVPQE